MESPTRKPRTSLGSTRTVFADAFRPAGLDSWFRWAWLPFIVGCIFLILFVLLASEEYLEHVGHPESDPYLRKFFLATAIVMSAVLATFTGWFVWLSRKRIEADRETVRDQQQEVADRERRIEQRLALDGATRLLAHEIRNPLNTMTLHCGLLERAIERVTAPDCDGPKETLKVLRAEMQRLNTLVTQYLKEKGPSLVREPVSLEPLAREVVDLFRLAIDARAVELVVRGPGTVVVADAVRLRQILQRLLQNAIEAVANGGKIWITCSSDSTHVTLSVRDNGPGFAEPAYAFRPFYSTKEHGSGLGLVFVHDVALAHGGNADASNHPDGGAEVVVRLPRAAAG